MKKIFDVLLRPSRMILLVASIAYAAIYAVITLGNFGGGFLPVLARTIIFVLTLAALVSIPVLLLIKKEEAAKLVLVLLSGYWLISSTQNYLSYANWAGENAQALEVVIGIFGFLAGLALAGVVVLLVLKFILKKEVFKLSAVLTFAAAYLFIVVLFVLLLIYYIKLNTEYKQPIYDWTNFASLSLMLIAPISVLFGYLYFFGAPQYEFQKKAPKEEKEPVAEPVKEEAPEEEKPE